MKKKSNRSFKELLNFQRKKCLNIDCSHLETEEVLSKYTKDRFIWPALILKVKLSSRSCKTGSTSPDWSEVFYHLNTLGLLWTMGPVQGHLPSSLRGGINVTRTIYNTELFILTFYVGARGKLEQELLSGEFYKLPKYNQLCYYDILCIMVNSSRYMRKKTVNT